jgi:uroporphyrinogen decarboxylase
MTSRERVAKAVDHELPDRIPLDVDGSLATGIHAFAYKELCDFVGLDLGPPRVYDIYQMLADVDDEFRHYFDIDVARVELLRPQFGHRIDRYRPWTAWNGMGLLMPAEFDPHEDDNGDLLIKDPRHQDGDWVARMPRHGYYFDPISKTGMSAELDLIDPDEYRKRLGPMADDDLEYAGQQARELHKHTDYALVGEFLGGCVGLPLGFGDVMVALATEPQWCREILLAGAEQGVANVKLYHEAVGDRCTAWLMSGSDYGTQKGELFRPETFEDLFAPAYKMVNDAVHAITTAKTMIHTCGSVRNIIGTIADAGFDILNPVQVTAANMDAAELKAEFGDRLVFWGGGINTQGTLPEGTPEEVAAQVHERCRIFGQGGGFVFAAIHNIQPDTPVENLVAMFAAVRSAKL